ncbi:MAG: hypothetical protein HPM95_14630 [Alphaproteobacteria bacterium]|nr:hypothetical protein [Alphaproteobacteria bacterium]
MPALSPPSLAAASLMRLPAWKLRGLAMALVVIASGRPGGRARGIANR